MKPSPRPPRTFGELSDSLHYRLDMYALAASAAGVGMLLSAHAAEAKIIYTKAHIYIPHGYTYHLDLNHYGKTDFVLQNKTSRYCTSTCVETLIASGKAPHNRLVRSSGFAAALRAGSPVGPHDSFANAGVMAVSISRLWTHNSSFGPWVNVKNRYLGLRFTIKGKTHYGWARLNVTAGRGITAALTGYAYETVPDKPIIAGKTKGPDVVTVPQGTAPGSLGRLALGRK